jgi:hypothetical protein
MCDGTRSSLGRDRGILVSNTLFTFGPRHFHYVLSAGSPAVPMLASIFAVGLLFAVVFHRSGNLWIGDDISDGRVNFDGRIWRISSGALSTIP